MMQIDEENKAANQPINKKLMKFTDIEKMHNQHQDMSIENIAEINDKQQYNNFIETPGYKVILFLDSKSTMPPAYKAISNTYFKERIAFAVTNDPSVSKI